VRKVLVVLAQCPNPECGEHFSVSEWDAGTHGSIRCRRCERPFDVTVVRTWYGGRIAQTRPRE